MNDSSALFLVDIHEGFGPIGDPGHRLRHAAAAEGVAD